MVIDLGDTNTISKVGVGFLQDANSWIFMPISVTFKGSVDGKNYFVLGVVENDINPKEEGAIIKDFTI